MGGQRAAAMTQAAVAVVAKAPVACRTSGAAQTDVVHVVQPAPATQTEPPLLCGPADPAPAATPRETTCSGAGLPGDLVLASPAGWANLAPNQPHHWELTPFFTETLPAQSLSMERQSPNRRRYATLRDAMNGAYGELYEFLPLLVSGFVTFDPAAFLKEKGALVVAEKINQVFDGNRPPKQRVDFICYRPSGTVVRHHPGQRGNDAAPHEMPWGCSCFARAQASVRGVGNALHQVPPKYAALLNAGDLQPGDPLPDLAGELITTRAYMNELSTYDICMVSTKFLLATLERQSNANRTENWTNGGHTHFPWWVWLANTGRQREASNNGVLCLRLHVANGQKWLSVNSVNGNFEIHFDHREKIRVTKL